jgi:hypothetical protein
VPLNAHRLSGRTAPAISEARSEETLEAHLLFRCETERRVAVGRDVGEF